MKSFTNPYNIKYGKINNSLINLQLKDIVKMIWSDTSKQERILNILSNICCDKETIIYRQEALRDLMFNVDLYNKIYDLVVKQEKCYISYSANASSLSKVKLKSDTSITETTVIIKDFALCINDLLLILERLNECLTNNVTSKAFKEFNRQIKDILENEKYEFLKSKINEILNSSGSFSFYTELDDKLCSSITKYILSNGKYQPERTSLFKKKTKTGKIDIDSKLTDDFKSLHIDAFYRIAVLLQDIFESLYEKIACLHTDFIYFETGIALYHKFWEKNINSIFPSIGEYTEYKNAYDPFLIVKYLFEGYSARIYGNDIVIKPENDILVIGNNNSGKTVLLRTIGILQILTQVGYTVPCNYAQVSLYDSVETIFSGEEKDTDVGGRFEKEAIEISEIIDNVNSKSLIIINEIFQSTFVKDGEEALINILNYFSEIKVKWICVSHLLNIALRKNDFNNMIDIYNTTGKDECYKIRNVS